MAEDSVRILKDRLRADLKLAMKARNSPEASLLRSLLAAIDNAEAPAQSAEQSSAVSRSFAEGAAEVGRLALSGAQLNQLLMAECDARLEAAADMVKLGQSERAKMLRAEAALVKRYLD